MEYVSISLYSFNPEDLSDFIKSLEDNQRIGSSWIEDNKIFVNIHTTTKG